MRIFILLSSFILVVPYSHARSHCLPAEVNFFSCQIENSSKIVSLCGTTLKNSRKFSNYWDGRLQYRFGSIGKPELTFPKSASLSEFTGEVERHNSGFDTYIHFVNRGFHYSLASVEGVEEENERFYGIIVHRLGDDPNIKPSARLRCKGQPVYKTAPGYYNFFSLAYDLETSKRKSERVKD